MLRESRWSAEAFTFVVYLSVVDIGGMFRSADIFYESYLSF